MEQEQLTVSIPSNDYTKLDFNVKDFRDLDIQSRKIFVQRFIDLIIYNPERFQTAMRLLEKWEKK